jgi:hypothetical protein
MKLSHLIVLALLFSFFSLAASAAPLLHYNFDEGTGTAAADSGTGAPAPGTLVGATWTTNTPQGYSAAAVDSSGASAGNLKYVTGGDVDKIDGLSQFTLTAWLNLQATPSGNRRILAKQDGGAFDGFSWNISDPGNGAARSASAFGMRLFVGGSTAFAFDPIPSSPSFVVDADNKWAFVAVTYDGTLTSNNTNYYAGSEDGTVSLLATTTVNGGTVNPTSVAFNVGHTDAAPASNTSLPGYVDDARVYGSVLTLAELELVRRENVPEPASFVAACLGLMGFCLVVRRAR